jgi:hydroxymethylpyrimidine/phosphomethylpyrimidine kinase
MNATPVALSIAGSDSGGGAGIQADLRTFGALGAFGTTVITAITAQNLDGVAAVFGIPPATVQAQLSAVVSGFNVSAVKTGMLWSAETVRAVARSLAGQRSAPPPLVVDPVMVATSGARLVSEEALVAYRDALLPLAQVVTPNLDEAAVLLDCADITLHDMPDAARQLAGELGCSVLLKGGHLDGAPVDMLFHDSRLYRWRHARIDDVNTHGSGCMLSAALAAQLAHRYPLPQACARALAFVHDALLEPIRPQGTSARLARVERAEPTLTHLEASS